MFVQGGGGATVARPGLPPHPDIRQGRRQRQQRLQAPGHAMLSGDAAG